MLMVRLCSCPVQLWATAICRIDCPSKCFVGFPALSIPVLSIDKEEEHVDLSLLEADTGKSDVLPESLGLPLRLIGEEKRMKKKRKLSESEQVKGDGGIYISLYMLWVKVL